MEQLLILKEVFNLLFDESEDEESDNNIRVSRTQLKKCNKSRKLPSFNFERHNCGNSYESGVTVKGPEKSNIYFVEDIIPEVHNKNFKQHFRVEVVVFEIICRDIYPFLYKKYGPGRNALNLDKQVMMTLCYLGNKEGLRSISDRFGVCTSTSWRIVSNVCNAILKMNDKKHIIKWPNQKEADSTTKHYCAIYNLKGVIGCLGSCHIKIRAPINSNKSYKNKAGTHSILLQAVSNEKMEFIYYHAGEYGSLDNSSLVEKSGLECKIKAGTYKITNDQHLLGDCSYPSRAWLITPYPEKEASELSDEQTFFNTIHSECHEDIKRSFGLLKARFQRLYYIDSLSSIAITKFIVVCCILHNICLQNSDIAEENLEYQVEECDNVLCGVKVDTAEISCKRDLLMNCLYE